MKIVKILLATIGKIALYIISIVLGATLIPLGLLWGIGRAFVGFTLPTGIKNLGDKFLFMAKSFDKYGGVACKELFNDLLISKKSLYQFGKIEQTISMVLGYNQLNKTLTWLGWWVVFILNLVDKNHCIKAIELDK